MMSEQTFYQRAGGEKTFNDLVSHFYALVAVNPILRPMYPDNDLHGAAQRLQMFLSQYWGGPTTYSCLLYTSPSPRDKRQSRMPSSA